MNLDENQKQQVAKWVDEGLKFSDIQNRLASDLGIKLTYMEVRFLVDDLKLTLKDPEPPEPAADPTPVTPEDKQTAPALMPNDEVKQDVPADPLKKGVSVSVDALTRPGTLVSGKVTFSDGNVADWYLDQTGRLGLAPKTEGYRPSAADVQEFQVALEREITRAGL